MSRVRKPAVAGTFYPSDINGLRSMIEDFLKKAAIPKLQGVPRGLVVPHAGYVYSGIVAAAGYKLLSDEAMERLRRLRKVILIGPSHYLAFEGAALSSAEAWQTPLGAVSIIKPKKTEPPFMILDAAHKMEHCLEAQVPWLQFLTEKLRVMPIVLGEIDPKEVSEVLIPEIDDQTIVIISSDLSHYYPYQVACTVDKAANEAVPVLDFKRVEEEVDACGKLAVLTLMYLAKHFGWKGHFIDYKNSGDTAGDKKAVVGYACYAFTS